MHVDLVVARSVVRAETQGFGERGDEVFVPDAGDVDGAEGAVGDQDVVEGARLAFLDEVGAVGGFGFDEFGDFAEGVPGGVGAEKGNQSEFFWLWR